MIYLKSLIKELVSDELDSIHGMETMNSFHISNLIKGSDKFTIAYITAALWSSNDNLEPNGGKPLDKKYSFDDLELKTLEKMIADCKDFQQKYSELYERGGWDDNHAGHDFWLTRNGHGTGFWDRGYGQPEEIEEIGKQLTKASKSYGEYNLYLGDGKYDGLVCGG